MTASIAAPDPIGLEVPEQLITDRLVLRCPQPGDGAQLNAAVCESLSALRPWMPWAREAPTLQDSEVHVRRAQANFRLRDDLVFLIFERQPDGSPGLLVGACGLHRMDWSVRRFEIGYWRRTGHGGKGVITGAVKALTRLCFDTLAAQRVEIRMDATNGASRRVAERADFTLEGVLRRDSLTPEGTVRDTAVYARVRGSEEAQT